MYAFHIPVQMTLCCRNCLVRANRHIHVYDTVLLKQKKRTVLDITGFFFRMSTQVKAEVFFFRMSTQVKAEVFFFRMSTQVKAEVQYGPLVLFQ